MERWIREQDWESVIENHLCPYVEELLLVGDENGETPAQVLVNIALELWTVYGQSEDLRNRIEDTLHNIGIYVLEQGYDLIETIIRQVLGGLSTDKFIYFIESKVEDDSAGSVSMVPLLVLLQGSLYGPSSNMYICHYGNNS